MHKTFKPMMAISTAILMMVSPLLCGCNSEQPKETKKIAIESSSTNFDDTVVDSDMAKKEKEEITNKKANVESAPASSKEEIASESLEETNSEEMVVEEQETVSPQSTPEEPTPETESIETQNDYTEPVLESQNEEPGNISGRLYIPDLGINVGLYMVSAYDAEANQAVCDAEDSAAYMYDFPGRPLIGDHNDQSFSTLFNSYIGMPVYIYGQEYVCVENGYGENNGETIIVAGGDVRDINDGLTTLYTCANPGDWNHVWYTTVAPV